MNPVLIGVLSAVGILVLVATAVVVTIMVLPDDRTLPAKPGEDKPDFAGGGQVTPLEDPIDELSAKLETLREESAQLENQWRETYERTEKLRRELSDLVGAPSSSSVPSEWLRGWFGQVASTGVSPTQAAMASLLTEVRYSPQAGQGGFGSQQPSYPQPPAYNGGVVQPPIQPPQPELSPEQLKAKTLADLKRQRIEAEKHNRSLTNDIKSLERIKADLKAQVETLKEFAASDLVFIQAGLGLSLAAGIEFDSAGQPRLIATAEGEIAKYVNQAAARAGKRRVTDDGGLTRDLCRAEVGVSLPGRVASGIKEHWQPRRYVPAGVERMVTFLDTGSANPQHRVGYYLDHDDDGLEGHFVGSREERVSETRISPASALVGKGRRVLERSPTVDYLDFALLSMAKEISTDDPAIDHRLAVRTKVEIEPSRLDMLAGDRSVRYMPYWIRNLIYEDALSNDLGANHPNRKQALEGVAMKVNDEVVDRIRKLGIGLVEREDTGDLLFEQELRGDAAVSRNKQTTVQERGFGWAGHGRSGPWWSYDDNTRHDRTTRREIGLGPSVAEADNRIDAAKALRRPVPLEDPGTLEAATHVLFVEVGEASSSANLNFAFRLSDTRTGDIVWTQSSERPITTPALATTHMLASGTPFMINCPERETGGRRPGPGLFYRAEEQRGAGNKLKPWIGYLEAKQKGVVVMRDLFTFKTVPVSWGSLSRGMVGEFDHRTPEQRWESNKMRVLMWKVCGAVRPPAGRVTAVEDLGGGVHRATVSCYRASRRFKQGQPLMASRVVRDYGAADGRPDLERLPLDLSVQELKPDSLLAVFDTTERDALWSVDTKLSDNDIVCGRNDLRPVVHLRRLELVPPSNEDRRRLGLDAPLRLKKFMEMCQDATELMQRHMDDTFSHFGVERVESDQSAYATHTIDGWIRPTTGEAYTVEVSVNEVGRRGSDPIVIEKLGREQLDRWTP
ncbi:MAG: hypothetical protein AAGJ46_13760 [Planctomycetota bacterium]